MFTKDDFIAAMVKVECAIDACDGLRRRDLGPGFCLPARITVDRDGFTVEIDVLPTGAHKRQRFSTIHGHTCETPAAAADSLIDQLDIWTKAIA